MEEKSNTQSHSVRGIEIFGHAIGGVGQNMVYALWSGFITAFYTDIADADREDLGWNQ